MVLNTITVVAAVTPEIVGTCFSHCLDRQSRRRKPTAHLSYDLGLHLVRRFVEFSALHTVEEIQAFTSQWVPAPTWVKKDDFEIPQKNLSTAATHLQNELGPDGIEQVGGRKWWQWRPENSPLKAEWIEMRQDYNDRKSRNDKGNRVMLYIHGGGFYFGSVDEHRYQMQRHARKLKALCLAPRYRLAPQFPFPCGLHDCLAAYLYLLDEHDPSSIVLAGDSAGGSLVLSLLVIMRDQNIPLPAGAILISPWVDLTHSFPSIGGDGKLDYIPCNGFIHKPSIYWPPPTTEDDQKPVANGLAAARKSPPSTPSAPGPPPNAPTADIPIPSLTINGTTIRIRDQIQLYAPNHLLTHPLVSPALQPSLGGLCPLLIQTGGGELLRDEQIYIAHKAANPSSYPAPSFILDRYDGRREAVGKWRPTDVQIQLWDDVCHVGETLAWTGVARGMYRSVAQFGAWALARAQRKGIEIEDEVVEKEEESSDEEAGSARHGRGGRKGEDLNFLEKVGAAEGGDVHGIGRGAAATGARESVGRAGDPLPPFQAHMIRQKVDRHGNVFPLPPPEELSALRLKPDEIGVLKEAPVRRWLRRQEEWNKKFAGMKRKLQEQRAKEKALELIKGQGLAELGIPMDENPPPTALVGMTVRGRDLTRLKRIKRSWGMTLWSKWGSKHDQFTLESRAMVGAEAQQQEEAGKDSVDQQQQQQTGGPSASTRSRSRSNTASRRPRSYSRTVSDQGQAGDWQEQQSQFGQYLSPEDIPEIAVDEPIVPLTRTTSARPTQGGIAYPFKLVVPEDQRKSVNPSMITLESAKLDDDEAKPDEMVNEDLGQQNEFDSDLGSDVIASKDFKADDKKSEASPMEEMVSTDELK